MLETPPPLPYKDRKVGLVILGMATILFGLLCALFVPLTILSMAMAAKGPNPPPPTSLLPVECLYGGMAIALVWLGVGSVMARRWARALLVIGSWSWFVIGLMTVATMGFLLPRFAAAVHAAQPAGQPELSSGARTAVMVVSLFFLAFLFVCLPLVWALFYGGRNAKATCEARDPVARWTDRCPLPVLAVALWLLLGTASMFLMPSYGSVAPFFGLLLSGTLGTLFYIVMGAIWAYCAWAIYRLDPRGWWIVVIVLLLFGLSNFITYTKHDLGDVYAAMGYSAAQLGPMRAFPGGHAMAWMSLVFLVPLLGYLLYIRKFFAIKSARP